MNVFGDAIGWILDPANWLGANTIGDQITSHMVFSFAVTGVAFAIAFPLGAVIGHTGRGRGLAVVSSGAARALPTLGVLFIVGLWVGVGVTAPAIALIVLAVPPILAGTYAGIEAVDAVAKDAAKASGMTGGQVFASVELPLSLPLVVGGVRSAMLQVIATATLAGYLSNVGLGATIFTGYATSDYAQMLGASLLIIALALSSEGLFTLIQRLVVPAGVRAARRHHVTG